MAAMIWDSAAGAFKDAETPLIWDEQMQAWKDSIGLVYDDASGAWAKRWESVKYIYNFGFKNGFAGSFPSITSNENILDNAIYGDSIKRRFTDEGIVLETTHNSKQNYSLASIVIPNVDLSDYSKIHVYIEVSGVLLNNSCWIFVSKSNLAGADPWKSSTVKGGITRLGNYEHSLDVSSLNGKYCIALANNGSIAQNLGTMKTLIKRIWMD